MTGETFTEGELFVYTNGARWELGMVKSANYTGDGYFCWYSSGDTAANTPTSRMHKLVNHGFSRVEHLLRKATNGAVQETHNERPTISGAVIEVTPRIDWARMAQELRDAASTVEAMADDRS